MGGSLTQRKMELLPDLPNDVIFTTNKVSTKDYNLMTISMMMMIIIITTTTIIINPQ
jgi:hypothetical protein